MRQIHFIGIGGVGMNGVAQLAALSGYTVTGSDRAYDARMGSVRSMVSEAPSPMRHTRTDSLSKVFPALENLGIRMVPQDGFGITGSTDAVVYSTAIESDNPDIQKSNLLGIPLLHRAEMLKELIGGDELIAIAGTAGKSTVTGLLGWIFQCLEKDPSVYNGAAVLNWKQFPAIGNIRKGNSNRWIIEADESDRSFLQFHPTHTIITNISKDHFELDELHRLFDQFKKQTSGIVVETRGQTRGQSYKMMFSKKTSFYRTDPSWMIGRHNLENAMCAFHLCEELGMDMNRVREAVASFKGIERRLEIAGTTGGITVIDDYAHNPVKIAAALAAAAEIAERVHAFWRPHGFTPLFQCLEDLIDTFSNHWKTHSNDSLCILPVYYAGGTVEKKITSRDVVEKLNSAGVPAVYVEDYPALKQQLEQRAQAGDAILGMGARDPELPLFAKQLVSEWKNS